MNKRQREKLDKRLYQAIKELNEDIAKDLDGETEVTEQGVLDAFNYVKKRNSINQTLKAHRKFILNK